MTRCCWPHVAWPYARCFSDILEPLFAVHRKQDPAAPSSNMLAQHTPQLRCVAVNPTGIRGRLLSSQLECGHVGDLLGSRGWYKRWDSARAAALLSTQTQVRHDTLQSRTTERPEFPNAQRTRVCLTDLIEVLLAPHCNGYRTI